MARYENILGTVGNTPVVRLRKLAPDHVKLYAKVESFNPMGSVKDRLALGLIEEAERSGALQPGQTVVEATSGNTGIGLAMVCAQKGYPLVIVMAENFSVERRKLMRFLGARVVLTPAPHRGTGMLQKAAELAEEHGWFLCRQFENEANADVHSRTTAREILDDFDGERLDYWVTGFGTGGTLKGVARVLKQERDDTRIVVVEPDNSRILASGIPQPKSADGTPSDSHPRFRTHVVQGWSPDFVPKLAEDVAAENWIDEFVPVTGEQAMGTARRLAAEEGIFVGVSGGATAAAAIELARRAPAGSTILCMLPDTGERYLSTPMFYEVPEAMTDVEESISRSTPNFRFDEVVAPAAADPAAAVPVEATPEAAAFVEQAIHDAGNPVVMFTLEWCEFCWSVRKLFNHCGIPLRTIVLDSAEAQKDDWGGGIRDALQVATGSRTVPQLFVGGTRVGGSDEVFAAFRDGSLQRLLEEQGVSWRRDREVDPGRFRPSWLQA